MCHTFILLTFLTVFFFLIISKLTAAHIDDEIKSVLTKTTKQFLVKLDDKDKDHIINWTVMGTLAGQAKEKYSGESSDVKQHNLELYDKCVMFLIIFAFSIICLVVFFLLLNVDLRLKFIVVENFVIFALVGMVEVYFFLNIASKYVPVLPDVAVNTVVARFKHDLSYQS
jgi:hypothetical protein